MRKPALERSLVAVLAAGVVAGVVWAFLPAPLHVDAGRVTRGSLEVTVNEDGRTRVKDRYVVSAPLAGRAERSPLRAGDALEAGTTVLAVIEAADPSLLDARARNEAEARVRAAEAARKRAEASAERARAAHDLAAAELRRARQLVESEMLARRELDVAVERERGTAEDVRSADFGVEMAAFEVELARAALGYSRPGAAGTGGSNRLEIRSPIAGRVLRVFQESAAVVATGAPLLEVADPSKLEAEIDVLSADAVRIAPGARVWFEHWGGEVPLRGTVRVVEPGAFTKVSALGVEEQRVNVIADFADGQPQAAALGDGYRVDARIVVWEGRDVLKVPAAALFRRAEGWAVFAITGGRARLRPIVVGHSNDVEAEVRSGIGEGEAVVLYPSDRVGDGTRVAAR